MTDRPPSADSAVYLYCLVSSRRRPSVARVPRGLPNASPPRVLDAGGHLWLVVADVPLKEYGEHAIARHLKDLQWVTMRAIAHESVIERFADADAVVPSKLFTMFRTDDRALAYVAEARARLDRVAASVAGSLEWGVRLVASSGVTRPTTVRAGRGFGPGGPGKLKMTGADFLKTKRALRDAERTAHEDRAQAAQKTFDALSRLARDVVTRPPAIPSPGLLLDAAFLVPRRNTKRFRAAVTKAKRRLARGNVTVTLTGPWPPYHFIAEGS
jgi:hypothetical protein